MKAILKAIVGGVLKGAEVGLAAAVPGGQLVDAGVRGALEHRGDPDVQVDAALLAVQGGIQALEAIEDVELVDEAQLRAGCLLVHQGITQIRASVRQKSQS